MTDCSPPGSSVHGILQARVLEWVAISYSRESSWPRDWACTSCTDRRALYHCASRPSGKEWTQAPETEGPGFVLQLDNHDRAVMRMLCNPRKLKLPHVNFLKNNYSYFSWLWELNKKKDGKHWYMSNVCSINESLIPHFSALPPYLRIYLHLSFTPSLITQPFRMDTIFTHPGLNFFLNFTTELTLLSKYQSEFSVLKII